MSPELASEYTSKVMDIAEGQPTMEFKAWMKSNLISFAPHEVAGMVATLAFMGRWKEGDVSVSSLSTLTRLIVNTLETTTLMAPVKKK